MTTKEKEIFLNWANSITIKKAPTKSEELSVVYDNCLDEIETAIAKAIKKVHELYMISFTGLKTCISCGGEKRENNFWQHKGTRDGLTPYCKVCSRNKVKEYMREKQYKYQKKYKENNPHIRTKCDSNYQKSDKGIMTKIKRDMVKDGIEADKIPNEFLESKLLIKKIKKICKTSQNSETHS